MRQSMGCSLASARRIEFLIEAKENKTRILEQEGQSLSPSLLTFAKHLLFQIVPNDHPLP